MEQRRTQRYNLQLPLHVVQLGEIQVNRVEKTRDISSRGVCFVSPISVAVGGRIEYVITLSGCNPSVRIHCLGKVLRSMKPLVEGPYEIAVTMDRYMFVRAKHVLPVAAAAATA
jgi:hypothetical protein